MSTRRWLARLGLAGLLALGACASLPPKAPPPQRPLRESLADFSLEGRLSVKREGQNYAGLVSWQHRGGRDEIMLSTPLGQGIASLVGDEHQARLELADHRSYTATDVEGLSEQVFGARMPLSHLPIWVLGRATAEGRLARDALQRPAHLVDQGWEIDYQAFESDAPDALPTRLFLQRGNLEVRLAIDSWTLENLVAPQQPKGAEEKQ